MRSVKLYTKYCIRQFSYMEACLPPRLNGLGAVPYARQGAVQTMASDARRDLCGTRCLGDTRVRRVNEDDAALAL